MASLFAGQFFSLCFDTCLGQFGCIVRAALLTRAAFRTVQARKLPFLLKCPALPHEAFFQMFYMHVASFEDKMRSLRGIGYLHAFKRSVSFGTENIDTLSLRSQYALWQSGGKYFFHSIWNWNSPKRCIKLTGNKHKPTQHIRDTTIQDPMPQARRCS